MRIVKSLCVLHGGSVPFPGALHRDLVAHIVFAAGQFVCIGDMEQLGEQPLKLDS